MAIDLERRGLRPPPGDRASALINASLDCIVTIDTHGDVVEFNPMAEQVLGWTRSEALGRNLADLLIPAEYADAHRAGVSRYLAGEESTIVGRRLELPVIHRSGRRLTMELMVVSVVNDGRLEFTAFMRDVTTERAQARQLADVTAQMRTLIDHLASGVLFEDDRGQVLVINQAMIDLFGVPVSVHELVGTQLSTSAHLFESGFADPEEFVASVRQCFAEQVPSLGKLFLRLDGRTLARDYLPVVVDDSPVGHLWVFRDITEAITQQQVLEDQNRMLAELADLKNEFVARASHELRSPLTSVVSFTEILSAPETGPLQPEQAQYVDIVLRNARRLLRLIEDLLLMTKLESRTLPLDVQDLDLADLCRQVVSELVPRADVAGVHLACHAPGTAPGHGDAVRLHQVVSNVVVNAVAHTPRGGSIDLSVTRSVDDTHWQLAVVDTGEGVRADDLPRLFDPFYRASSATGSRSAGGSGLGLAIVKLIVDLHGGSVEVDSSPGSGTTISVRLPDGAS